jgi:acyl-CoA synthetase (AMP-forming)/AMP-acid ligase II
VSARVDERGELHVSGPNMARGYAGGPEFTEHATGDLARLSGGRIVLVGRSKDMIIRGSTNIYPGLYEPAVAALPGVAAALMVGVPDEIGDERVVLALVPAPDAGPGLAGRVRAALPSLIDAAALPDEVVVLDALPVAGRTRKPDRRAVREMFR